MTRFGMVTEQIALDPTISPSAKAVYLVLVIHRNGDDGTCWPSNTTLVQHTGLSLTTVHRAIRELLAAGVITRQPRFNGARQTASLTGVVDGWGVTSDTGEGVTHDTPGGVTSGTQNRTKGTRPERTRADSTDTGSHQGAFVPTSKGVYDPNDPETWWAYDGPIPSAEELRRLEREFNQRATHGGLTP